MSKGISSTSVIVSSCNHGGHSPIDCCLHCLFNPSGQHLYIYRVRKSHMFNLGDSLIIGSPRYPSCCWYKRVLEHVDWAPALQKVMWNRLPSPCVFHCLDGNTVCDMPSPLCSCSCRAVSTFWYTRPGAVKNSNSCNPFHNYCLLNEENNCL